MKRFFLNFLAIFFPWIVLLINDDPVGAIIALMMQVTIIGWIPAALWARRSIQSTSKNNKTNSTHKPE